jgi:hypothetical protein
MHGVVDDAVATGHAGEAQRRQRARALTLCFEQALHPDEDASADRSAARIESDQSL